MTPVLFTNTPAITATAPLPDGNGTFFDPNAPAATQIALPVAPSGETGPSWPVLPEQNSVVVSYAGQIVPLLAFSGGNFGDSALAQGEIFDVNSRGEVAAVGNDRWLYINGVRMDVSPASIYGVPDNLSFGDVVWSPDGQRVAFRVDAANPNEQNAIDSGVWIFEPATRRSWQIFRSGYEGQVAQLHEQRQPVTFHWAPNGTALVIKVTTPLGFANVFMPAEHNVNEFVNSIPYADATWAPDSASLIVSGVKWNQMTVVGRVALDQQWTYTEYLNQMANGLYMHAAIQLFDGRIAFLGGPTPDAFSLYVVQPAAGALPVPLSIPVNGRMLGTEWNTERTAALVTVQTAVGNRLWIVRIDGTVQDVTPTIGSPSSAHWR
jgi:hypothetical protein